MTDTTKEEFIERFVAAMLRVADKFDDGSPIEPYARATAETYWDEPDQRAEGPEECAWPDISYWED